METTKLIQFYLNDYTENLNHDISQLEELELIQTIVEGMMYFTQNGQKLDSIIKNDMRSYIADNFGNL